jgi:hypothetical protein
MVLAFVRCALRPSALHLQLSAPKESAVVPNLALCVILETLYEFGMPYSPGI